MNIQENFRTTRFLSCLGKILFYVGTISALLTMPAAYAGEPPVWVALTLGMIEGLEIGAGIIIKE